MAKFRSKQKKAEPFSEMSETSTMAEERETANKAKFLTRTIQSAKTKLYTDGEELFAKGEFLYDVFDNINDVKNPLVATAIVTAALYTVMRQSIQKGATWLAERLIQAEPRLYNPSQEKNEKRIINLSNPAKPSPCPIAACFAGSPAVIRPSKIPAAVRQHSM